MSKEIEEIFKDWLKEKPKAKILVKENAQMGYIIEFAEYYNKQKIEQLEKEVEDLRKDKKDIISIYKKQTDNKLSEFDCPQCENLKPLRCYGHDY